MKTEIKVTFTFFDMIDLAISKAQGIDITALSRGAGQVEWDEDSDEYTVTFKLKEKSDEQT